MQSPIGPVLPDTAARAANQNTSKSSNETSVDKRHDRDTFQSIMSRSRATDDPQKPEDGALSQKETATDQSVTETSETQNGEEDLDLAQSSDRLVDTAKDAGVTGDEIPVTKSANSVQRANEDEIFDSAIERDVKSQGESQARTGAEAVVQAASPGQDSAAKSAEKARVPAWFSARRDTPLPDQASGTPTVKDTGPAKTPAQSDDKVSGQSSPGLAAGNPKIDLVTNDRARQGLEQAMTAGPSDNRGPARENVPSPNTLTGLEKAATVVAGTPSAVLSKRAGEIEALPAGPDGRGSAKENLVASPSIQNSAATTPAPVPGAASQTAAANAAFNVMQADIAKEKATVRWISDAKFSTELGPVENQVSPRVLQTTLLQQPELPRHVATQLAHAFRNGGGERPMELVLSPAELGRVRISMQANDGGMVIQVIAERPETLDLMRRHISDLAQEFRNIGYGSAEFSFGQSTPDGNTDTGSGASQSGASDNDLTSGAPEQLHKTQHPVLKLGTDRVDIRL